MRISQAEEIECSSCRGYGHFDENGDAVLDMRGRKCLDCNGTGVVPSQGAASHHWENEAERLRELCNRQQDEIETLTGFADAVEALRDIGKVTGCDHVDCPDGRRQLVNCVEQTIEALRLDVLKYRKILAFVPAKIAIAAKEKAGYPTVIRTMETDQ